MPAQRIAQQPVARQTVEALEPLAHVRGPRRQIDPCRRPPAEHAQSRSSTPINCAKVWASNPLPISGQRGQAQPLLPAELNLAQPAGFVFGYQLPGFRTTPAAPHFDHLCLLVHPFTESRTATRGKMGCSNAYV